MKECVQLFTDGSCLGNPGAGGWGVIMRYRQKEKEMSGGEVETTNNRMELMAAIIGLESLTRSCTVRLFTDSRYVIDGIDKWLPNWKRKGWKTAGGGAVKNRDLWERLERQNGRHSVEWNWVKGHSGHPENERVDRLAHSAAHAARGD